MKPSFALNLDHDGISLLHRQPGGWRVLGEVMLDDPELLEKLKFLRRTAIELATGRFACKVVIPNSQILYRDMPVAEAEHAARKDEIGRALAEMTPYSAEELAFTWDDAAPNFVHVAAVARETLAEAEAFAKEHRFNPLCFVAIPPEGKYPGEPVFALSDMAADLLDGEETLETDDEAIVVLGDMPDVDEGPVAEAEPDTPLAADTLPPGTKRGPGRPRKAPEPELAFKIKADTRDFGINVSKSPEGDGTDGATGDGQDHSARAILWAVFGALVLVLAIAVAAERFLFGGVLTNSLLNGALEDPATGAPGEHLTPGDPGVPGLGRLTAGQRKLASSSGLALSLPLSPDATGLSDTPLFTPNPQVADAALPALQETPPQPPPLDTATVVASSRGQPGAAFTVPEEDPQTGWDDTQNTLASIAPDFSPSSDQMPTAEELAEGELDDPENLPLVSLDDADRIYAAIGVWARSPAPPIDADLSDAGDMDQLYIASIDPVVVGLDAFAMPPAFAMIPDASVPRFSLPPEEGTYFLLDDRGLVRATPEGTLTQDGIFVYLGAPSVKSRPRPEDLVPPELRGPDLNRLAEFRPRPRPNTLAEDAERARLGGMTMEELAEFRPRPRPRSAQENIAAGGTATVLAMARSATPKPRPANFDSIVQKTRAAAEQRRQAAAAARAAVPTSANVAEQATADRVLRLSQVNLIGVFGTPSNRRALVRLPSGRFIKVQIGDVLDGGRVAGIDTSSLVYVKGGKTLKLAIPAG